MYKRVITTLFFTAIVATNFATTLAVEMRGEQPRYKLELINEDYGFLQNSVLDISQDSLGYMWYATPNGLYRYDGYTFNIFYNEPDKPTTIERNFITDISVWLDGESCFSNGNVISLFDHHKGEFISVDISKSGGNISIRDIASDLHNSNLVWVLSDEQILLLETTDDHHAIESVLEVRRGGYEQIFRDAKGYMWLLSKDSVVCCRYDPDSGITTLIDHPLESATQILQSHSGEILIYSNGEILKIAPDNAYRNFELDRFSLVHNNETIRLNHLHITPDGDLVGVDWDRGIYNIDIENQKLSFGALISDMELNEKFGYKISYIDNSCVLWVGSRHGGLYKINLKRKEFNSVGGVDELAYTNQISGDGKGNLYIGTHYNGIKHKSVINSKLSNPSLSRDLGVSDDEPIFAVNYHGGALWYATTDGEIYRANCSQNGVVTSNKLIARVAAGLGFFHRAESGRLYYGVFSQMSGQMATQSTVDVDIIYVCDNSSSTYPVFTPISTLCKMSKSVVGVSSLLESEDGTLWIGSYNDGLFRVSLDEGGDFERVELPNNLTRDGIFSLYEGSNQQLYIGTFGGGLVVLDEDGYTNYTRDDGLANNAIYSIEDGSDGSLWLGTDEGLSRFDTVEKTFQNYDTTDGVLGTNGRKWSSWRSPNGRLFFGGVKGVNYFTSESINENNYLPKIQITALKVGGDDREYVAYTYSTDGVQPSAHDYLPLAPDDNDLRFEFASLHFENPKKNQYQYILRGVDSDWHYVNSTGRSVIYSNLSHGKYEFLVRGTNSDGVWSDEYAGLSVVIEPHWWQTWYAKACYLLILIIAVYMLYIFVSQRNRHRIDNRLNQAKLDFFTNISHEIKTPLTIISGLLDLNSNNESVSPKDMEMIRRNNKRMLALVTQLLDFRKVTQGHAPFKPSREDVVPLLNSISESFSILALKNGIDYRFANTLTSCNLVIEADKIEKIVANLLSNAFKYTPQDGGVIELSLRGGLPEVLPKHIAKKIKHESSYYTTIAVRDNGMGIAPEHIDNIFERFYQVGKYDLSLKNRGVGVGLAYSKVLSELHEGFIYVDSVQGDGSTFYLILPESLSRVNPCDADSSSKNREEIEFLLESKHSAVASAVEGEDSSKNKELLIVEDNQEIREFLREILSPIYKIHEAANGREGLEMAEKLIPDIIISDVMMPEMDGITLCNKLKTNEKTDHIPIILLTANSTIDHRVEGIRSGADSYIPKPFNMEHLKVRIEKLLQIRTVLKNKYMQLSGHVDLEHIDINSVDKEFLASVERVIEDNLDNSEFSIEMLEQALKYNHMQLYRKIKSISGVTVVEFIRNYRLKRSVDMMRQGHTRINEIMYTVGFSTPSYFSKSFKNRYDKTPVEFIEELHKSTNNTI